MADPNVYPGIKYWKCGGCGATFLDRDAARNHKCASTSIVEVDNTVTSTTPTKEKSSP